MSKTHEKVIEAFLQGKSAKISGTETDRKLS